MLRLDLSFDPMNLATPPLPENLGDSEQRLESWKEIAAYLKRGVRTVQRWEQSEGLPVHRHHHDKRGTVYAFRSEIETWRLGRRETDFVTAAAVGADVPWSGWMDVVRRILPQGRKQRVAVGVAAVVIFLIWK